MNENSFRISTIDIKGYMYIKREDIILYLRECLKNFSDEDKKIIVENIITALLKIHD
jgi:hypothetical protein